MSRRNQNRRSYLELDEDSENRASGRKILWTQLDDAGRLQALLKSAKIAFQEEEIDVSGEHQVLFTFEPTDAAEVDRILTEYKKGVD